MGKLKYVLIRLASNPKVHQVIDIIVVDIQVESYGLLSNRYLSQKLNGYFAIDLPHLWLPHNGKQNKN